MRDEVFSKLVGREVKVSHILEGFEEALRVGLKLVKVNVCVVRLRSSMGSSESIFISLSRSLL